MPYGFFDYREDDFLMTAYDDRQSYGEDYLADDSEPSPYEERMQYEDANHADDCDNDDCEGC